MDTALPWLSPKDLVEGAAAPLDLSPDGRPVAPLAFVDLDRYGGADTLVTAAAAAAGAAQRVLVGVGHAAVSPFLSPLLDALAVTLVPRREEGKQRNRVGVDDPSATAAAVAAYVQASPRAALTLVGLLRLTERLPVPDGLVAESLAYSMLLAGPEFAGWQPRRPRRPDADSVDLGGAEPVLLSREGSVLRIELNRPRRHNAFSREVRDGLVEALDLVCLDPTITQVELAGRGPSYCSGGDLDEFGTAPDVAAAHLIRLRQSAGHAVHRCAERVRVKVHGACIGAGIEIPAFAGRVAARNDAYFQLPELRMGLIPGAGGTVSVTRRIGRWRTAYLVLSGAPVDASTALRWGLVDSCVDH
ncbi:enoyl-CoA hydratase/isomerase family protein [Streptomyces sp. NPDC048254]|uniref:enoyl-CoA hydratase/isomerase family protein n=1 Tax=Streptomyces sp. NPDC048254 TaxID=3365525 RepID=UPI003711B092